MPTAPTTAEAPREQEEPSPAEAGSVTATGGCAGLSASLVPPAPTPPGAARTRQGARRNRPELRRKLQRPVGTEAHEQEEDGLGGGEGEQGDPGPGAEDAADETADRQTGDADGEDEDDLVGLPEECDRELHEFRGEDADGPAGRPR